MSTEEGSSRPAVRRLVQIILDRWDSDNCYSLDQLIDDLRVTLATPAPEAPQDRIDVEVRDLQGARLVAGDFAEMVGAILDARAAFKKLADEGSPLAVHWLKAHP